MILTDNQVKESINNINEQPFGYFVISKKEIYYNCEGKRVSRLIELTMYINLVSKINTSLKALGIEKKIDLSILYKVQSLIVEGNSFTDSDIKKYLELEMEVEKYLEGISTFYQVETELPNEIYLLMFGANEEDFQKMDFTEIESLSDLRYNAKIGKTSIEKCIKQTKELLKKAIESQ